MARGGRKRGYVRAEQEELALGDDYVGFLQLDAPVADRFHFPPFECDAGLETLFYEVIVEGFPVFDDTHARFLPAAIVEAGERARVSVVEKTVLVGYSAKQMFELVDAAEAYPQFLPWCSGAEVAYRDESRTRATLHVNYRGIKQSFTTENTKEAPTLMQVKLVSGPFRELDGTWRFTALAEHACRIDFRLHYEFSNRLLEKLVGPVFSFIANTMVDAFVKRADQLYGK